MGAPKSAELDMTPMIDVVFQLMIFFLLTLKMEENINKDIELDMAPHGTMIKEQDPRTLVIEVDRAGRLTMYGSAINFNMLSNMVKNRYAKYGEFPVLIRGDRRCKHEHVKKVMDVCTANGLWRLNFMAIKEKAGK
jgi:biopolymer transport protein ExbD